MCLGSANCHSSTWRIIAEVVEATAFEEECVASRQMNGQRPGRCHPPRKTSVGRRMIARILRHYEALWDTQMLATIICVLSSASKGGGTGVLLLQEEENLVAYERHLTRYAELLFLWGSNELHLDVLNHLQALKDRRAGSGDFAPGIIGVGDSSLNETTVPTSEVREFSAQERMWLICRIHHFHRRARLTYRSSFRFDFERSVDTKGEFILTSCSAFPTPFPSCLSEIALKNLSNDDRAAMRGLKCCHRLRRPCLTLEYVLVFLGHP